MYLIYPKLYLSSNYIFTGQSPLILDSNFYLQSKIFKMNTSKKNSFFHIGPVSSALMRSTTVAATGDMPGPPAKGAFSEGDGEKQKEFSLCKSQQLALVPGVLEDFFWIGNSIVAFSKWRLGYMGEFRQIP